MATSSCFKKTTYLLLAFGLAMFYPRLHAQTVVSTTGSGNYVVKTDNESLQVKHDGRITIGPDDRSVTAMDENGYLSIQKSISGKTREVRINRQDGSLHYEYKEDGRSKPFDPEGKAWLADILPDLLRTTTIGAASRVDRIYSQGGVQAVISELPNLKSDHVRAHYTELLLNKSITAAEIPQIISGIGRHINSDHYRYELFSSHSQLLLSDPQNTTNYLEAIKTVKSDHYKSGLVKLALSRDIPQGSRLQALELVASINSDHSRSEILKELTGQQLSDKEVEFMLEKLIPDIRSDHFKAQILEGLLMHESFSKHMDLFIREASGIRSDHFRKQLLEKALSNDQLNEEQIIKLINSTTSIRSDHFKSELLEKACQTHGGEGEKVKNAIREAAGSIRSTHFYGKVMRCIE